MNDADIEFEISMLQDERCGATDALEGKARDAFCGTSGGGKLVFQESSVS